MGASEQEAWVSITQFSAMNHTICVKCEHHSHYSDQRDHTDEHLCSSGVKHEKNFVTGITLATSRPVDCYSKNTHGNCKDFLAK